MKAEKRTGRHAILEQFICDGLTHMFGNPGTVEQGFLDALDDYSDIKYILMLQESIAVLTADGYARATQKPALVQLHSSPGIGNAVGALYQAKRGHAPLVVIAGDAGLKYMNMDAQMAADLVGMMEPVTKYATMVLDHRSLLRTLRRAIKIASTPPMGPVYVCLPADVLDMPNDESVFTSCTPSTRVTPDPSDIEQSAKWLLEAKEPVIYVGDGVAWSQATEELRKVAELLGAKVYGVDEGDLNMDHTHPCYMGMTGHMFGDASLNIFKSGDANLIVGTYMAPEVFPELGDIFDVEAKVIHFDLNAYEIAKNHRVDLGIVCDPKRSLALLADTIKTLQGSKQAAHAMQRLEHLRIQKEKAFLYAVAQDDFSMDDKKALHMAAFAKVLGQKISPDTIIFDEALTNSPDLTRYVRPKIPGSYFMTRGGSLGIGIPGAIGAKLAYPNKTVIGFSGDGGSMYTIQALYSAKRHNCNAKFVICNNGSYRLLQLNVDAYWKSEQIKAHAHPLCFDLSNPPIRFVDMARSMGVEAVRVEKSEEIAPAIDAMLAHKGPFLIDLVLEGDIDPSLVGVKCGQ